MLATLTAPHVPARTATRPRTSSPPGVRPVQTSAASSVSVATLVLWVGCSTVGVIGALVPYARPTPPRPEPLAVKVEQIQVELAPEPVLQPSAPAPVSSAPPPPAELSAPAAAPAPVPVASLTDAVAFAVPVEGNVRIVDLNQAGHRGQPRTPAAAVASSPAPQTLIFGQGEGRQPAPVYPARASRMGQEGVVTVRFTVGTDGRVIAAEPSERCVWPLLNEAAVRTVRHQWRFKAGPVRVYDVAIRFQLRK